MESIVCGIVCVVHAPIMPLLLKNCSKAIFVCDSNNHFHSKNGKKKLYKNISIYLY